ncbi:MAG: PBP1A family penicillin-binding protein [Thermodesulfovibrionales bacterium]
MARGRAAAGKKRGRGKLKRKVWLFFFLLVVPIMTGAVAGGYAALSRGVPSMAELKNYRSAPSTRIYAEDDTLIGELKLQKGVFTPLERIPRHLVDAVVAVEDSHFWEHSGIDYLAILRAAVKDALHMELREGGSTITQQLAKITFLTPEKTIQRKLKEAILATRIEKNLSKSEIMELYLNRVYFGHGAYGAEMASRTYFGKSVEDLTLPESALLAGLLKAPNSYSPYNDFEKAKTRQSVVLRRMEEVGLMDAEARRKALEASIYLSRESTGGEAYGYFVEYLRKYLVDKYGADMVYKGGLKVYTALNRQSQLAAQQALQRGLRAIDKRRGFRGPEGHRDIKELEAAEAQGSFRRKPPSAGDILSGVVMQVGATRALVRVSGVVGKLSADDASWARRVLDPKTGEAREVKNFNLTRILRPGDVIRVRVKSSGGGEVELALEQEPEVQGAVVMVEPYSGFIRAMVGGYDYSKSEFNRAVYALRQPGSAFKPIVYALALEKGYTPASIIMDEETTYETTPEDIWTPRNYDEEFHGPTRLRDALAYSRNVVTVKIAEELGIVSLMNYARRIGIDSQMPRDYTLALGSLSLSPLDLTMAYSVFANGGVSMRPVAIKYVTDRRGRVLESNEPEGKRVMDAENAFLVTSMMQSVIEYGTGWRAKALHRPAAGKTGTTNEYRDAWFVGYTPDIVTGVWVGFDSFRSLGEEETGSRAASPIWLECMKAATKNAEPRDFPVPEGIVRRLIDPKTGLLANDWTPRPVMEYFRKGNEPKETAPSIWDVRNDFIF